jgi:hypothetical protein
MVIPGTYPLAIANFDTSFGTPTPPVNFPMDLAPGVNYTVAALFDYFSDLTSGHGFSSVKAYEFMPFPGGKGPIWECPSAFMAQTTIDGGALATADNSPNGIPGGTGFFSYVMNIDLKRESDGTTPIPYPTMPQQTAFRKPSATVFMFDMVFDPVTEIVSASPQYSAVQFREPRRPATQLCLPPLQRRSYQLPRRPRQLLQDLHHPESRLQRRFQRTAPARRHLGCPLPRSRMSQPA